MIHDLIYAVILTVGLPFFLVRALCAPRRFAGLGEKAGFLSRAKAPAGPAVWFHCVSVGETIAAVELIRAFRKRNPQYKIIVSTTTATGRAVAEKNALADAYVYFPFDFSCVMRRFLAVLQPRLIVLMEMEVWPNLVRLAHARGIPVAVVNGRMTPRSLRGFRRWRALVRPAFARLAFCGVQDEAYRERFIAAGAPVAATMVTGNLKYDALRENVDSAKLAALRDLLQAASEDLLLIGGSTHAGEEELLLATLAALAPAHARLRLVLVPRHPERLAEVQAAVRRAGRESYLKTALTGREGDVRERVIIVDTMGELALLYKLAAIAFVGGSFSGTGGHNMLEPAIFRKPVIVGPSTFNFSEDMARLRAGGGVLEAADGAALTRLVAGLLDDPARRETLGAAALEVVRRHRGALERTLTHIQPLLV
ncbi:MAG: 3-deoxy-D-manno-octulosonic acid transferase [Planctomycetota bacterium]